MRLATRLAAIVVYLGAIVLVALALATVAIGTDDPTAVAASGAGSGRPAADSWRTEDSVDDGIPVAIDLADDFLAAWSDMSGIRWQHLAAPVVGLVAIVGLVKGGRRLLRRHHRVRTALSV